MATKKKTPTKKKKDFVVEIVFNDAQQIRLETNNLEKTFLEEITVPDAIKCETLVKVTSKEGNVAEKYLNVSQSRRAFGNKTATQLLAIELGKRLI